ncbi:SpoIID/LytB domain-containing protein [Phycicoccus sp. CSK15P-2]|uniref:cell wall-binding repeat-containing protein n=1 Tax=Phycicoccus sp. CSK15P-2 TaxID=2807627 RepID=UPI001951D9B0|nr:cell wall-binding repeat-containing protein [Phycicoccus sp. CSK15P-2]MBM6402955.1 SpoIID/LytB domain-containing protein [Phycicoccus sp. CSK15P-2]
MTHDRLRKALAVLALVSAASTVPAAADTPWGADQARPNPGAPSPEDGPAVAAAEGAGVAAADSSTWRLSGAGWGHGVGMSQYGAMEMAKDGYSAAQILGHYYTDTGYTTVDDTAPVHVNLRHGVSSTTVSTSSLSAGGGTLRVVAGGTSMVGPSGASATVRPSGSGVVVSCSRCTPTSLTGGSASVYWDDGRTLLTNDGTRYRDGSVTVSRTPSASTLEVVARVRLHDEYLDYIREVPWSWPSAALQAQAAAARGYAYAAVRSGIRPSCSCHVYDTTESQVFGGYPSGSDLNYWSRWTDAVRAAGSAGRGYVVTYGGEVVQAFYSSSTGGRTQNSEDGFSAALPYLRSVDDHWSLRSSNPRRSWSSAPARSTLAGVFGLSDVARLDLSSRYVSGAVRSARATSASGATAAVSGATLQSRLGLSSTYVQRPVTRYGGATRYSVAAAVSASHLPSATTVVIASGEDGGRADAAVSGPLAQALAAPLLLTRSAGLPSETRRELTRRTALRQAVVVGGETTVSADVVRQLQALGLTVTRIGGADRYEVSARVASRVGRSASVGAVVVASGSALADALGAGGPAGAEREPILLTRQDSVPGPLLDALDELEVNAVRVLGGTASVGDAVVGALDDRPGTSVLRLSGRDRYDVAAEVAGFYRPRLAAVTRASVTSGTDAALTDALTAGSLPQIALLTRPNGFPGSSAEVLQRSGDLAGLDVLGGTTSVPSWVATAAARS